MSVPRCPGDRAGSEGATNAVPTAPGKVALGDPTGSAPRSFKPRSSKVALWDPTGSAPRSSKPPCGRLPGDALSAPTTMPAADRKSTRLNSSHGYISYAVFCLKKKKKKKTRRKKTHRKTKTHDV